MNPVLDFTALLAKYKVDFKYWPRVLVYCAKFALFEPFRFLEKYTVKPKLKDLKYEQGPLFILGYYRSGTTHLQEVLLEDPDISYMNFFKCYFSTGFFHTEKFLKGISNWILRQVDFYHPAHNIPFHMDLPAEEDVALVCSGYGLASNWGQLFPQAFKDFFNKTVFFETISEKDYNCFKREYRYLIDKVQFATNQKLLLLKSPPSTARIKFLLELFPNAKFIYIERSPYKVFKSNLKLWKSFKGQHLSDADDKLIRENILWSYKKCLEFYERDKSLIPKGNLVELKYEVFSKKPMNELKRIYENLGLKNFEAKKEGFERYLAKKHKSENDPYTFKSDEFEAIESYLKPWLERGAYQRPEYVE
jgi:omega-hydroxy-beta-dihydromenaquinone-9 sulfotransferase